MTVTIYITVLLKCMVYWKQTDTMWSVLSGWDAETAWRWQVAVPRWWGQGYPDALAVVSVCTSWNHETIFYGSSAKFVSIISLQKSGQPFNRKTGESLKVLSTASDGPLELVDARGRCSSTFIQGGADTWGVWWVWQLIIVCLTAGTSFAC